jgi:hypothetical protein
MATLTLEYNPRNSTAKKIIDFIFSMDSVFDIKTPAKESNLNVTLNAIKEAEAGDVTVCESFDDYLKKTAKYA